MAERDGGFLRDSQGRPILKNVPADTPPAITDILMAGTLVDADGREIVTIEGVPMAADIAAVETRLASVESNGGPAKIDRLPINVKNAPYNATGDGTTDDAAAIQAAINAAAALGIASVFFPRGTYYIATQLLAKTGVSLQGAGSKGSVLKFAAGSALSGIYYFGAAGGAAADRALTADLAIGDNTITVANATNCGFVAGSVVMIAASSVANGGWSTRVASVAGNVVTLEERSPISLSVATHAPSAYRFATFLKDVTICDLAIRTDSTANTTRKLLIDLWYIQNVTVERCDFADLSCASASAVQLSNGLDCTIRDNKLDRILSAGNVFVSLPINVTNVTGITATGNATRDCSSGISFSACPRSVMSHNRLYGNRSPDGRATKMLMSPYSSCVGNVIDNFGATTTGIRCTDSSHCSITGNVISNVGIGIHMGDGERPGVHVGGTIYGNTLNRIDTHGIIVQVTSSARATSVAITGNTIDGVGSTPSNGTSGIYVAGQGNTISGNTVRNWGSDATPHYGISLWGTGNLCTNNTGDNGGAAGRLIISTPGGNHIYANNPLSGTTIQLHGTGTDIDHPAPRNTAVVKTADYALIASDTGKLIEMALAANGTLTIPDNATVPFPIGTLIRVTKMSTGNVAVAGAAGVALISKSSLVTVSALYGQAELRKRGTNQWHLTGDLA